MFAWCVSSEAHQCASTFKVTVRKHAFLHSLWYEFLVDSADINYVLKIKYTP